MHRWLDASPAACCGVCPTCLTATASGLTIELVGGLHRDGDHARSFESAGALGEDGQGDT